MEQFAIFFGTSASLVILSLVGILLFVNKEPSLSKNLLAIVLITIATTALAGVGFYTKFFIQYPFLYRLNAPLTVLVLPTLYVYTRSVLAGENRLRKLDWLLLIPSLLLLLNLIPFWALSHEEKSQIISRQLQSIQLQGRVDEGFLPAYVVPAFRALWSLAFITINYRLISVFKKTTPPVILHKNKALLKWLTVLNTLFAILVLVVVLNATIAPIKKTSEIPNYLGVGVIGLIIGMQLLLRPGLLYGLYYPLPPRIGPLPLEEEHALKIDFEKKNVLESPTIVHDNIDAPLQVASKNTFSLEESYRLKKIIETLFDDKQVFLNTSYNLEDLVKDAGIPRYTLSAFINREYNTGFREFMNSYRVEYFKQHFDKPEFNNLTLEAIAAKCGFFSRSTFISNFKKITGQTPTEYITAVRIQEDKSVAPPVI